MIDARARHVWLEAVLASARLSQTEKIVALAIGLSMNVGTGECYPSYERIGRKGCVSARTAMRAVASLEASGWLVVTRSKGRKANSFALALPDELALPTGAVEIAGIHPANPVPEKGANLPVFDEPNRPANCNSQVSPLGQAEPCQNPVTDAGKQQCQIGSPTVTAICHPNRRTESSPYSPPNASPSTINATFDGLCEIWSGDIGDRGRARTAFHRAVTALGVEPDRIIEAAREIWVNARITRKPFSEPLPKWLRREGWTDSASKPTASTRKAKAERPSRFFIEQGSPEWRAWTAYRGRPFPTIQRDNRTGWDVPSLMPPGAGGEAR